MSADVPWLPELERRRPGGALYCVEHDCMYLHCGAIVHDDDWVDRVAAQLPPDSDTEALRERLQGQQDEARARFA